MVRIHYLSYQFPFLLPTVSELDPIISFQNYSRPVQSLQYLSKLIPWHDIYVYAHIYQLTCFFVIQRVTVSLKLLTILVSTTILYLFNFNNLIDDLMQAFYRLLEYFYEQSASNHEFDEIVVPNETVSYKFINRRHTQEDIPLHTQ